MEPIKELTLNKKMANQYLIMGGVALLVGMILFALAGNGMLIGFGILFMIMGGLNKNLKVVTIHNQYLEIKLGIIASKKLIKYNQITSFSIVKKVLELHYIDEANKPKKVRIQVKALEKEDITALDKVLHEKTDLEGTNSLILIK
ncbi:hypothetical protein ACJRPK_09035 [Aquimarina sp. 2-A2]|uniref:hypothetical protein n=1 Tax=Aquimarina sp. 2-A2 TaxID=3382644 RepID=UPI00387EEFDC